MCTEAVPASLPEVGDFRDFLYEVRQILLASPTFRLKTPPEEVSWGCKALSHGAGSNKQRGSLRSAASESFDRTLLLITPALLPKANTWCTHVVGEVGA